MRTVPKIRWKLIFLSAGLALAVGAHLIFDRGFLSSQPISPNADNPVAFNAASSRAAPSPPNPSVSSTFVDGDRLTRFKEIDHAPLRAARSHDAETASSSEAHNVQSIDWDTVHRRSPIPRKMPTGESDDPLEAGFAPQWVERALGGIVAVSFIHRDQSSSVLALPLAMKIISERKNLADTWAYGVEYEIRGVIAAKFGTNLTITPRVFCSTHGCLCYFEGMTELRPLSTVAQSMDEPWARDFGIDPLDIYVTNGGVGPKEFHWQMILISRTSR